MKNLFLLFFSLILSLSLVVPSAFAKGGSRGGGSHSHSKSSSSRSSTKNYSTGKSSSTHVKGYTKKNGKYVAPHRRTTPDKSKKNNWSTKGNVNPYTGKLGTKEPYK